MPVRFTIPCINADATTETAAGELSDADVEVLSEFVAHAERLRQTEFVRGGGGAGLHLEWKKGQPLKAAPELPERPSHVEFIHEMRPFVLQDEATYYYKVAGILGRSTDNPCFRQTLRAASDQFSGRRMNEAVRISAGDRDLTSDAFLRDWLNAYEYHRERAKRREIEALHAAVPLAATEAIMLMLLVSKANAVMYLSRLAEACIQGGFQEAD
jgi:hypothetical protein